MVSGNVPKKISGVKLENLMGRSKVQRVNGSFVSVSAGSRHAFRNALARADLRFRCCQDVNWAVASEDLRKSFEAKKENVELLAAADLKRELSVLIANAKDAQQDVVSRCSKIFAAQVRGLASLCVAVASCRSRGGRA